jgi:hypothetical protein
MLAQAANTTTEKEEARVAGLMLDWMLLLAPRAAAAGHTIPDVLRGFRAGFDILSLHRAQRSLPSYSRRLLDELLSELGRYYRSVTANPAIDILDSIDRALVTIRYDESEAAQDALLGLAGLRRSFFPNATPPILPQLVEAAA